MSQSPSIFHRLSRWFRGEPPLPLEREANRGEPLRVLAKPVRLLTPWRKRDDAIHALQSGFADLTGLISSIKENLDKQGRRQDEMIAYLSHLPEILHSLPEATRVQGETLKTITQHLQQHVRQQEKLAEVLEKVNQENGTSRQTLENVHEKVESMHGHNEAISDNLRQFVSAMEGVTKNADSSTQVLREINQNIGGREEELQKVLQRQSTRVTVLLIIATAMSLAAVVSVIAMGVVLMRRH